MRSCPSWPSSRATFWCTPSQPCRRKYPWSLILSLWKGCSPRWPLNPLLTSCRNSGLEPRVSDNPEVSRLLRGFEDNFEGSYANDVIMMANAAIVSWEVEHFFSTLKDLNTPKRACLTEERIKASSTASKLLHFQLLLQEPGRECESHSTNYYM